MTIVEMACPSFKNKQWPQSAIDNINIEILQNKASWR